MIWDKSQKVLLKHLKKTEEAMNELLSKEKYKGNCRILPNIDLGFPHDVIRLGGGFATGIYVSWNSLIPFVPVDICMNACTVSIYKLEDTDEAVFDEKYINILLGHMKDSSYIANFHRGNHFISYLEDVLTKEKYIIIHSSAIEFETLYNGLYPVEGNWVFENTKVYDAGNGSYIRYLDGKSAVLFLKLAQNLYTYNENRHDFIVNALIGKRDIINEGVHYHHYGMPSNNEAIIGCHLIESGAVSPLLTRPGENVFLLKYEDALNPMLKSGKRFITPHGFGKEHIAEPELVINKYKKQLILDGHKYGLRYGESLRNHPTLRLREISVDDFMYKMKMMYDFSIVKEYRQLASYNKNGYIKWEMEK